MQKWMGSLDEQNKRKRKDVHARSQQEEKGNSSNCLGNNGQLGSFKGNAGSDKQAEYEARIRRLFGIDKIDDNFFFHKEHPFLSSRPRKDAQGNWRPESESEEQFVEFQNVWQRQLKTEAAERELETVSKILQDLQSKGVNVGDAVRQIDWKKFPQIASWSTGEQNGNSVVFNHPLRFGSKDLEQLVRRSAEVQNAYGNTRFNTSTGGQDTRVNTENKEQTVIEKKDDTELYWTEPKSKKSEITTLPINKNGDLTYEPLERVKNHDYLKDGENVITSKSLEKSTQEEEKEADVITDKTKKTKPLNLTKISPHDEKLSMTLDQKMTNMDFVELLKQTADEKWKYEYGSTQYKNVDCVGLYKYIMKWYYDSNSFMQILSIKDHNKRTALTMVQDLAKVGTYGVKPIDKAYSELWPGMAVFVGDDKGRISHVGYYIGKTDMGDHTVVEAKGKKYGVVYTQLENSKFNFCGMLRGISYEEQE